MIKGHRRDDCLNLSVEGLLDTLEHFLCIFFFFLAVPVEE